MINVNPTDLIISPPNARDPRFRDMVLMVVSHGSSGTVALALNGESELATEDIAELTDIIDPDISWPIFWGGPRSPESIWMLHDSVWSSENTMEIGRGVSVSSDIEMLAALNRDQGPETFRLFNGYVSWAPGQLAAELEGVRRGVTDPSWLIAPCLDFEEVLACPPEDLWTQATAWAAQTTVNSWLN